MEYNWKEIVAELNKYLKLKLIPIGIQKFSTVDAANQTEKIRWPKHQHMPCQILAQSMMSGFTMGISQEYVAGDNCSYTIGIKEQNDNWRKGEIFIGGWCNTAEDAAAHHKELTAVDKAYEAIVCSPLSSERIEPDACVICCSPSQAFFLLGGYLRNDFKAIETKFVGESGCSMTWVKTLNCGEIGVSVPCFAEVRYAGLPEENVIVSLTPEQLVKALRGVKELNKAGMRYPIASYAAQMDVREGVGVTYDASNLRY